MNFQHVCKALSQRLRKSLSHATFDKKFKLTLNVTVKITGEDQPVTLHETLASKKQFIGREDNVKEIVNLLVTLL